ncbi:MAG: hypothetical protein GXP28_07180, partial [Planctomycetes bacterium]|nr:hypothetical protein [Planctomycetota bacterium]
MTSTRRVSYFSFATAAILLLSTHAGAQTIIVDKLASYDPLDASAALQEAIDTPGITKVLIRNLDDGGSPLSWILGSQIDIIKKVDLELEFQSGVTVSAMEAAITGSPDPSAPFAGLNSNLFRISASHYITLSG